jgi:uncharacterized protein (TIGR04255 family)
MVTTYKELPNKPLVEAILEIKWGDPTTTDAAYPIIVGRLSDRLIDKYPFKEELDLAQFPSNIAIQSVRYRFRAKEGDWPLIQIGPGIVTLNDTSCYKWEAFRENALEIRPPLEELRESLAAAKITTLSLQYINAVDFDYTQNDMRAFLEEKLHTKLTIPDALFQDLPVSNKPEAGMIGITFPCASPDGHVELRIGTGKRNDKSALVWHTTIISNGVAAQQNWNDFGNWLDAAHNIARHWFFALVAGDLVEEFLAK